VFSLSPSATVDEGNNWINISWGPLAMTNPVNGTTLGNYAPASGSPAIDYILTTSTGGAVAPTTDFFGNPRPMGSGIDVGAVEFPAPSLGPALNFGNQLVLTTSNPMIATLNNPSGIAITGVTIAITGTNASEFQLSTTTCASTLPALSQCTISVTFTPSLLGPRSASLVVTDSAGTQSVPLTGSGSGPLYSVSPSPLSFPNTMVNTVSAPRSVTVRNNQTTPMTFTAIALNGLFGGQYRIVTGTTCSTTTPVASGATCVINVTFNPQAVLGLGGIRPANLQLTASGLTTNVPLSGTAILFLVDVTPKGVFGINGALTFANTQVGQFSATQIATLSNYQSTPVTVNSITMPSQFRIVSGTSTTCTNGTVLPPAATNGTPTTCTVAIQFVPTAQNLWFQTATFNLSGSGGVNPTILLMGRALNSAISGTAAFGSQLVNSTSSNHVFTLTNSGAASITVTGVTLTGTAASNYAIASNTCSGTVLAPTVTCQVGVTFTPSATGTRNATLTVTDATGTQTRALTGTGAVPTFSGATNFGNVPVGSSVTRSITLTNNANAGLATITAAPTLTSGQGFTIVAGPGTTCVIGQVLTAGGGNCTFSIQFAPVSAGNKAATLGVTDTAGTQTVALTGAGLATATTTPGSITFANTTLGSASATTLVTVANPAGNPAMTGTSIAFGGTNASYFGRSTTTAGSCPTTTTFTVNAGSSCTIGVVFAPPLASAGGTIGAKNGTMTITTTSAVPAPTPPVALSGTAQ
jgi:hypothetical protein